MAAYVAEVQPRFLDLDPMGHVNHAVYATYLEVARHRYYDAVLGPAMTDVETVVAHLQIDYERPIGPDDAVAVHLDVPSIGESSLPMAYEVRAGDALAATARTVQVTVDPATREPRTVPEAVAAAVADYHDLAR